jgi:hypothetical protein
VVAPIGALLNGFVLVTALLFSIPLRAPSTRPRTSRLVVTLLAVLGSWLHLSLLHATDLAVFMAVGAFSAATVWGIAVASRVTVVAGGPP